MVHGTTAEEVARDEEGLQIMRVLGRNMAYFLKCKEAGIKYATGFMMRFGAYHTAIKKLIAEGKLTDEAARMILEESRNTQIS